jgi:hypothetical protein
MVQRLRRDLDETFWRKRILPEEDRRDRGTSAIVGFRSPNIVDLWHHGWRWGALSAERRKIAKQSPSPAETRPIFFRKAQGKG